MGVPTTDVDICNLALRQIGEKPISSISLPTTAVEVLLADSYASARQLVLRKGVWNFAKKRIACARVGTPLMDYADYYQLPDDFIRLLGVGGEDENIQEIDYDISERYLLIDNTTADSINIRYIADILDVTKWDAGFRKLVILHLALDIAFPLTKKGEIVKQINSLLTLETPDAVSIDGQEKPPIRIQRSVYLAKRRGMNSRDNSRIIIDS